MAKARINAPLARSIEVVNRVRVAADRVTVSSGHSVYRARKADANGKRLFYAYDAHGEFFTARETIEGVIREIDDEVRAEKFQADAQKRLAVVVKALRREGTRAGFSKNEVDHYIEQAMGEITA